MTKPSPSKRITYFSLLLAALSYCGTLSTQPNNDSEEETWYQVELILFRQGGNPKQHVEQWSKNIRLRYPLDWMTLQPTEGDGSATLPVAASDDQQAATEPALIPSTSAGGKNLPLLPRDQLAFNEVVEKLHRSNSYRVLFHGGWRQAFVEHRDEPDIIMVTGEKYGEHRELEGSIELKLQRYLHITTNLWLTQFATNVGQERERWPELPLPPFKLQQTNDLFTDDSDNDLWNQFQITSSEYDDLLQQPYIIDNIALVQQTRRMRSKELHYIDHPLLGILIHFTPFTPENDPAAGNDDD